MADLKITQLTENTTPAPNDVLAIVDDPGGSPVTQKVEVETLATSDYFNVNSLARQALINGNFDVWQRGTSFTLNDDTYTADRWNLLVETNASWTIARDTDVPQGIATYSAKLSNITANNQVALTYFMEYLDAKKFDGKTITLSFYAKTTGSEISNLRAAVLSWTGTADTLTSDVISTWGSDGTNPTLATNWTMENTPSNLTLTNSWTRYTITATIDTSGMNNIGILIWVDDGTIASGDDFWITGVQLNAGSIALPFQPKSFEEELGACQRYYFHIGGSVVYTLFANGICTSTTAFQGAIFLPVMLRTSPTLITSGTANNYCLRFSGGEKVLNAVPTLGNGQENTSSVGLSATVDSGLTAGEAAILRAFNTTSGYLGFNAEL